VRLLSLAWSSRPPTSPRKISPAAEQALNVLQNDVFFALLVGTGVFLIGNGLAIVATRALPKWLGWVAVPLAVIAVTPLGWFVAIFALPIWAVIVSQRPDVPADCPCDRTGGASGWNVNRDGRRASIPFLAQRTVRYGA
jgi:hypothetical protein